MKNDLKMVKIDYYMQMKEGKIMKTKINKVLRAPRNSWNEI